MPTISGARTRHEPHAYDPPPPRNWNQETGSRPDEEDRSNPIHPPEFVCERANFESKHQSKRHKDESEPNKRQVDPEDPPLINGQLKASHHYDASWPTQDTACANAPPTMGPVTEPTLHIALMIPNHWPLCLSGTKSVTRISVRAMSPPPPTPWRDLPTRRDPNPSAVAATMAPMRKKTRATITRVFRPKM